MMNSILDAFIASSTNDPDCCFHSEERSGAMAWPINSFEAVLATPSGSGLFRHSPEPIWLLRRLHDCDFGSEPAVTSKSQLRSLYISVKR